MKCYNPTLQRRKDGLLIEAACGKCKACIINKKIILAKEIKMYNQNKTDGLFLTITYDEKEKKEINKREIQLFLKKLRKTTKNKIKYVIIGEYGKKTKRPHYHALLWNAEIKDLKYWKKNKNQELFNSKKITELWGKGFINIEKIKNYQIQYVANHQIKNTTSEQFLLKSKLLTKEYLIKNKTENNKIWDFGTKRYLTTKEHRALKHTKNTILSAKIEEASQWHYQAQKRISTSLEKEIEKIKSKKS